MAFMKRFPFFPFLFTLFPVISLFANNIREIPGSVLQRPIIVSLLFAVVLILITFTLVKNWRRAAITTAIVLILFFTFGHLYDFLNNHPVAGIQLGRFRFLAPAYLALAGIGIWWSLGSKRDLAQISMVMNAISVLLVVIPLFQVVSFEIQKSITADQISRIERAGSQLEVNSPNIKPDIYYIILDTYARADVLMEDFNFNNAGFLDNLRQMGFYVADCSLTNYPSTNISLGSSLNLVYLQDLAKDLPPGGNFETLLADFLKHNQVRKQLEGIGYRTVAFATGYEWIEWTDASLFLEPKEEGSILKSPPNPFEAMLMKSTGLRYLLDSKILSLNPLTQQINSPHSDHIARELFLLDQLDKMEIGRAHV
jgi:hypothetical protein